MTAKGAFNFNSIKVRLKLACLLGCLACFLLFQFHKGTIKTSYIAGDIRLLSDFNSIKVRLKPVLFQTSERLK